MSSSGELKMSQVQLDEVLAHLQANVPQEACGILGGVGGRVMAIYPVENELHSPTAYRMEPKRQIGAMLEIERQGWDILAIFHSHPAGPAVPSASDVQQAYYPESFYLIAALDLSGRWSVRAFEIVEGVVREAPVQVDPESA